MLRGPGLSKASRGAALRKGILTREGEELLFALAERMSEGEIRDDDRCEPSGRCYFGSTMLTLKASRLAPHWRGPLELEALQRAVAGSVRVRLRAMRLACADAAHRAPTERFGTAIVETHISVVEACLHIDVDLEVPLDLALVDGQAPSKP
jgi:hypothetical protein